MPRTNHKIPSALAAAQAARLSAESTADSLRSSELRYRRLFETARDGILLLDCDQGFITDANPFMTELLGYSHEELMGKELWEIGLLKDKKASLEAFQILKRDGYIRYDDLPLTNRNNQRREVEFVSNMYRENGHSVIQCNIRDITDRKNIEGQLAFVAHKNERIAETLQRSMLQTPPPDRFTGFTIATHYESALDQAKVGGDFFDAFELSGGKVAFIVGDVSGKGLVAAARTAEAKYALRAFLHGSVVPETALALFNDFLCDTYRRSSDNAEMFIVLAMTVVHCATGKAIFLAAGAEPSLVLRADGKTEQVEATGRALGIAHGATYDSKIIQLACGDTVIMVTDGITEARHGHIFLGVDGVAELAEKAGPNASLPVLIRDICKGAKDFNNGTLHDDICLLLARCD